MSRKAEYGVTKTITLTVHRCTRCGYQWVQSPHATQPPKNCANKQCKSPYWNKPRRNVGYRDS